MCGRGLSKYFPLTLRIRLLTLLPSPWHKMIFYVIVASCVASDLHKLPKWGSVTLLVLWYLFYMYLRVSSGSKHAAPAMMPTSVPEFTCKAKRRGKWAMHLETHAIPDACIARRISPYWLPATKFCKFRSGYGRNLYVSLFSLQFC